jgi:hypothetical protein
MVQVVENWAVLRGRLGALRADDALEPGPGALGVIDVAEARDFEGFPNLLRQFVGERLSVHVPDAVREQWREGALGVLRARLGGPGVVWVGGQPGDLAIEPDS